MKGDPEQRAVQLGEYIVAHHATVRGAAQAFGCSKSTVHKDVSTRLRAVSPGLFAQVQAVLARNKAERHLRGGAATRRKYQHSPGKYHRKPARGPPFPGSARRFCYFSPVRNCPSAAFSSRLTCA